MNVAGFPIGRGAGLRAFTQRHFSAPFIGDGLVPVHVSTVNSVVTAPGLRSYTRDGDVATTVAAAGVPSLPSLLSHLSRIGDHFNPHHTLNKHMKLRKEA